MLSSNLLGKANKQDFEKLDNFRAKLAHFFAKLVGLSLSFPELQGALQQLNLPKESDEQSEWKVFEQELRQVAQQHRDIGYEWQLTDKQVDLLETYLSANLLLVNCLNVAMVSDRTAIENRLLLVN